MEMISDDEKAPSQPMIERALGVQWNMRADEFSIKVTKQDKPSTRCGILSIVSSVYDTLGFVAPFVLTAKRILQDQFHKINSTRSILQERVRLG
jgi:hypothetical protein